MGADREVHRVINVVKPVFDFEYVGGWNEFLQQYKIQKKEKEYWFI